MTDKPIPPQHPEAAAPTTLDAAALAKLRALDPDGQHDVVGRVLRAFETSLTRMLAQLAAELDEGDPVRVSRIAHTLKSSAASVGALSLARLCAEIERRHRGGAASAVRPDVEQLLVEGHSALAAVGAMLRA